MNTDAAFLAAITSNPDDSLVRLVYADWLDEQGRAEADFLRTEHELTVVPTDQPRWHELFRRYQATSYGLPVEWCAAVRQHPMDHWLRMATRGAWRRLEQWCERHHPQLLETLNAGATPEEIAEVEETIGQPLPADVRESFAIHNGERGNNGFILGVKLLPIVSVLGDMQTWQEVESYNEEFRDSMSSWPEGAVQLDYSNRGWVPLTRDAGVNHIGVDLAPGLTGVVGQVIIFGRDEDRKCVLASCWAEFLADIATFLESGAVTDIDPDPDLWGDTCRASLGKGHPHDALRQWRQEGRWPVPTAT